MRSILYAVFAFGLVACADPDPIPKTGPPERPDMASADMTAPADMSDTEDTANPQDMTAPADMAPDMPEPDEGPDCTCTGESECCDGCDPINAGDVCDDGLECTLGTTCQDDGTCGTSTSSPCDAQLEHPDCQIAMCDEVAGCSSMPAREGFECGTPAEGTYDGVCESGVCVGQQQCECTEADGPCCDGCLFKPQGTECGVSENGGLNCTMGECGGEWEILKTRFLCNGTSAECPTEGGEQFVDSSGACMDTHSCRVATTNPCRPDPSCP